MLFVPAKNRIFFVPYLYLAHVLKGQECDRGQARRQPHVHAKSSVVLYGAFDCGTAGTSSIPSRSSRLSNSDRYLETGLF